MFFTRTKSPWSSRSRRYAAASSSVLVDPTFHDIFGIPVQKVPEGSEVAYFALGCFWGAEKLFWQTPGVTNTAAGYAGGFTPNPTYEEVCSARTGHTEIVKVSYDPNKVSYEQLLKIFFENHDPTQGMRQGNDVGTQYRSAIYTTSPEQLATAERVRDDVPDRVRSGRLRPDHHRDQAGAGVLLRRGLPPAVPGQEPPRLLPGARHRSHLQLSAVGRRCAWLATTCCAPRWSSRWTPSRRGLPDGRRRRAFGGRGELGAGPEIACQRERSPTGRWLSRTDRQHRCRPPASRRGLDAAVACATTEWSDDQPQDWLDVNGPGGTLRRCRRCLRRRITQGRTGGPFAFTRGRMPGRGHLVGDHGRSLARPVPGLENYSRMVRATDRHRPPPLGGRHICAGCRSLDQLRAA